MQRIGTRLQLCTECSVARRIINLVLPQYIQAMASQCLLLILCIFLFKISLAQQPGYEPGYEAKQQCPPWSVVNVSQSGDELVFAKLPSLDIRTDPHYNPGPLSGLYTIAAGVINTALPKGIPFGSCIYIFMYI